MTEQPENRASTSTWADRMQQISRRWIYLVLALLVLATLKWPINLKMIVSPPARTLYDAVNQIPRDKLVVVVADWESGTTGENGPQTEAIMRHLFITNRRFAILSQYPQGPRLAEDIVDRLAREYHKTYGVDWINWGYKYGYENFLIPWTKNIPRTIGRDINGTPVETLPVMKGVRDVRDVGMIVELTGAALLELWIQYVQGVYKTPLGYGCTGVMAAEAYPFLDAGQIVGMMAGLKGAAEYEALLDHPGLATYEMPAQSGVHLLIIVLIVLGNIGYFMARRKAGQT